MPRYEIEYDTFFLEDEIEADNYQEAYDRALSNLDNCEISVNIIEDDEEEE